MTNHSEKWDDKEKAKEEFLQMSQEYLKGFNYMLDSGLYKKIKSKNLKGEMFESERFLIGILASAFNEYSQLGANKRKSYESSVRKFLGKYNLSKDSKITDLVESTFDMIEKDKRRLV